MKKESHFIRVLRGTADPGEKKVRHELYVFFICLVISVVVWFLIAVSKEVYTSLEYPVTFIHAPADMVLVNKPDSTLTFRISSGGFEQFTLRYLSPRRPITVDLRNISLERVDDHYTGIFNTSKLSSEIRDQYRFAEELVSIAPENIYFRFEPLAGKSVPVVSNLKLEFQKQFRLADTIRFSPREVKVVGPRNLIDQVDHVLTRAIPVTGIGGPVSGTCGLARPLSDDRVSVVPDQVSYSLTAERFTESVMAVPVVPSTDRNEVKIFPETVNVTFLVSLSNFSRVTPALFTAVIDIPETGGNKVKAAVRLVKVPAFVDVTRIEPAEVDFLVLKK